MRGAVGRRAFLTLTTTTLVLWPLFCAAWAQDAGAERSARRTFAGLTVIARGEQEMDLATGETVLPQGGELVDAERGVRLEADVIRYLDGVSIEASGARLQAPFGEATADRVSVAVPEGRLLAEGGVRLVRDGLSLASESLSYHAAEEVMVLGGPVTASGTDLEAATLLLDLRSGRVLLLAPYRYRDGGFTLASEKEGSWLQLTPAADGSGGYAATSEAAPELLERLGAYLP